MMAALSHILDIDKLIVLDISPINQKFDVTSSNEWNMEHFFHCLKVKDVLLFTYINFLPNHLLIILRFNILELVIKLKVQYLEY